MSEQALTQMTTHDDGKYVRTALVIGGDAQGGSVDVLSPDGEFLVRLNLFTKDDSEGLWFALDCIDIEQKFQTRRALTFDNGCRHDVATEGNLVATDFRGRKET